MNNICPADQVPTMPFLFRSTEHMRKVLDGPIGDEILKDCEAQGFVGLAFYDSGSRSIYSAKKPVQDDRRHQGPEDPRAAERPVGGADGARWAPTPRRCPTARSTPALKTGLVDAAENNYPSYESTRHFEAAKFYTKTEHSMAPEILVFSQEDLGRACRRTSRR